MSYDDHVAVAEKEIRSSGMCRLADAAEMLYQEELRKGESNCHTKTKTLSEEEEEEERDKRISQLFPRKTGISLKKFVPQQNHENLSGASTSSSLLDLNTIPADPDAEGPANSLQWLSLSVLAAHPETEHPQNSPSSSISLADENTAEFEETEIASSRKRRGVQERQRKSKKAKVATFSWKGKETPEFLVQLMRNMNGTEGPRLIFGKKLPKTDLDVGQSRLLMPFKGLICNDFLNPVESSIVDEDGEVGAVLVDEENVKWGVILIKRKMNKEKGNGSLNYALISGWNEVVEANGLRDGDEISIWSFRWRGVLCFALVRPPPPAMAPE